MIALPSANRIYYLSSSSLPLPKMQNLVAEPLLRTYLDEMSFINDLLIKLNDRKDELVVNITNITNTVSYSFMC